MRTKLLYTAAGMNILFAVLHLAFWKLGDWNTQLPKLTPDNSGIMQMLNVVVIYMFGFGAWLTVILAGKPVWSFVDKSFLFFIAGIYLLRTIFGLPFFGFSIVEVIVWILCLAAACCYILALVQETKVRPATRNKIQYTEFKSFFNSMDYVDTKHIETDTSLRALIAGMLSYYPWWIVGLYNTRKILVRMLGLVRHNKPEKLPSFKAADISFTPGEQASFFTVHKAMENDYWIAETPPDKHLAAWLAVATCPSASGKKRYEVVTGIRYLHWTGPVYFNLIRPFHHLVLYKMMKFGAGG